MSAPSAHRLRDCRAAALLPMVQAVARRRSARAPPTIQDLNARAVDVQTGPQPQASAAKAMENYRRFLELQKTDPRLRAEALRRLGRPESRIGRTRAHGEGGHADRPAGRARRSGCTRRCSRPTRIIRATIRCSTSWRAPTRRRARARRRWRPSTASSSAIRRAGSSMKCSSAAASLLFSAKRYAEAQKAYEVPIARGHAVRVLRAESL